MSSWTWALLFKPFIGIVLFVAVFGGAWLIAKLLKPLFPACRLKDELFRESRAERPSAATDAGNGRFDDASIIGGQAGKPFPESHRIGQ